MSYDFLSNERQMSSPPINIECLSPTQTRHNNNHKHIVDIYVFDCISYNIYLPPQSSA